MKLFFSLLAIFLFAGCIDFELENRALPCRHSDDCLEGYVCFERTCQEALTPGTMPVLPGMSSYYLRDLTLSEVDIVCRAYSRHFLSRISDESRCNLNALHGRNTCENDLALCLSKEAAVLDPPGLCEVAEAVRGCAGFHTVQNLHHCMDSIIDEEVLFTNRFTCHDYKEGSWTGEYPLPSACTNLIRDCVDSGSGDP